MCLTKATHTYVFCLNLLMSYLFLCMIGISVLPIVHVPQEAVTMPLDVLPGTTIAQVNATVEQSFGPPTFKLSGMTAFSINETTGQIKLATSLEIASTIQLNIQGKISYKDFVMIFILSI